MKMKKLLKERFFLLVFSVLSFIAISSLIDHPLHAGIWDDVKEHVLLKNLTGRGQFIAYQRTVDKKVPDFPIEVISDGYKMVRVYQTLMDSYVVEWAWRVTLKNRTMNEVILSFDYKLLDKDSFLVVSSREQSKKIAPGETLTLEKTDTLPYESAKRVTASTFYIQLQK
ncbi:MAG: hypothetical protein NTW12_04445 [Deltaproteobacteria bacterium]|nr:hypothetical protein [Deltaproteobacteria bacterium]